MASQTHSTEEFIRLARLKHGESYDYSLVKYINNYTKIKIICKKHGEFKQLPNNHMRGGGCQICGLHNKCYNQDFIAKAQNQHGQRYDYSEVDYSSARKAVIIICKIHGSFKQIPDHHIRGRGCSKCRDENNSIKNRELDIKISDEKYKQKCLELHDQKYKYDKLRLGKTLHEKIIINCPKHGDFKIKATHHLYRRQGCPACRESLGERLIRFYLKQNGFEFETQKSFDDLQNPKTKRKLFFDFYLPIYNTVIEYDGKQHFEQGKFANKMHYSSTLEDTQYRDNIKTHYCDEKDINLIRIPYTLVKNIDDVLNISLMIGHIITYF